MSSASRLSSRIFSGESVWPTSGGILNSAAALRRCEALWCSKDILPSPPPTDLISLPFFADFDGDELNLHVPQTLNARAEAEALLSVRHNVLSAQTNGTTLGLVQDALLGV